MVPPSPKVGGLSGEIVSMLVCPFPLEDKEKRIEDIKSQVGGSTHDFYEPGRVGRALERSDRFGMEVVGFGVFVWSS